MLEGLMLIGPWPRCKPAAICHEGFITTDFKVS